MSKEEKIELTTNHGSPWWKFMEETKGFDFYENKPFGWHWFWGIHYLYNITQEEPYFAIEPIQKDLPDGHWLKEITDEDLKQINDTDNYPDLVTAVDKLMKNYKVTDVIDLSKLQFKNPQYFQQLIFPINVSFEHSEFSNGAIFDSSIFYRDCNFNKTQFSKNTAFNNALFFGLADFREANFIKDVSFNSTSFLKIAYFEKAVFSQGADFYATKMPRVAMFKEAKFSTGVNFGNADISGNANFISTHFETRVPYFHDAKVGTGILWDRSISLWPQSKQNKNNETDSEYKNRIINNRNDYENLVFHMKKLDKHQDEHFFFRQQMQWQRRENKITQHPLKKYFNWRQVEDTITLLFYWFYEILADYGYGIGRAFVWWAGHIVLGVLAIAFIAMCGGLQFSESLPCAISVSFANANPYTLLGFDSSSLMECYTKLDRLAPISFAIIKVIQATLGITFLFLLLLTLRVRFRLK